MAGRRNIARHRHITQRIYASIEREFSNDTAYVQKCAEQLLGDRPVNEPAERPERDQLVR
jgi:hypothetical protein